jgi:hypothetical protein
VGQTNKPVTGKRCYGKAPLKALFLPCLFSKQRPRRNFPNYFFQYVGKLPTRWEFFISETGQHILLKYPETQYQQGFQQTPNALFYLWHIVGLKYHAK